ncbi:MAG: PAS domain S-box protein [Planctomycetaceae bacterium]|nr:PAS domain S-box protein [Planctomycetaceae bacterium]
MNTTPESFLLFADAVPDPMLLVSGAGLVVALNRACAERLGVDVRARTGQELSELASDPPEELARYLRSCGRSRQPVFGALTIRGAVETVCRAEGSVVCPRTETSPAWILLRLAPKHLGAEKFTALRLRVEELAREVDRRRAAERLATEYGERLRITLASIGDAVIATDVAGRVTNMNAVAESLTGWTLAEARSQPLDTVFHIVNESTRQPAENPATRALREGVIVGLANHTVLIAKDGIERPIDDSAAPIRSMGGEIIGCVLVFRDITERHRQEFELREREHRFVTLAESVPQLVWMADSDGHIFWYNRRWYDYTGTVPEDMVGWGWQRVHDPRCLPQVLERWRESLGTGQSFEMVFPLRGRNGEYRRFLTRVEPIRDDDGRVIRWLGTNTDVEELERTRAALRENEERLRLAADATAVGILDFEPETGRLSFSEGGLRIWGFETDDPLTPKAVMARVHPDDRSSIKAAWAAALDPESGGELEIQHRLLRADGATRWVAAKVRTVFSAESPRRAVRSLGTMLDITDAKLAEQRLRFQLDLTRSITDTATTAIVMLDENGRCTFMNPAAANMIGFSFEEIEGGALDDFVRQIRDDDRGRPWRESTIASGLMSGDEVRDREDVFVRRSGERFPVMCNARAIARDGVLVGTILEFRDITDERKAAAALRESETRYRLVGEAANDAIWDWDLTTNRVTWNHGLTRAFGYAPEDVGEDASWWEDNLHPDDRARIHGAIHAAIEGGSEIWSADYRFRRADGTYASVLDRGRIVREHGKPIRMVGSMLDLTEREAAEAALRQRTAELNFTLAATGVGMWLNTLPLAALDWDERTRAIFHVPDGEAPTIDLFLSRLHADDRERTQLAMERALKDGSLYAIEHRVVNPSTGEIRWLKSMGQATYGPDGEPVRFDGINYDITDAKRLEEELRGIAAELSNANRMKDVFLATLAHELRNPLAPISNGLQLIRLARGDWSVVEKARALMDRQIRQMVRLVDDLMDASRIATGKIQLRIERVDVATVVNSAVETSLPLIESLGHDLSIALPPSPLLVEVDPTRLAQVLSNLLNNSAKHTKRKAQISLRAEQQGNELLVSVKDTGVGIAAAHLPRVFDMFSQVDQSWEGAQGGLGIGLALVKSLVELHGGTVEARSEGAGQGAEFVVRIPCVVATSAKAPIAVQPDGGTLALRVLVVDDNTDSADSLAIALEMMGSEVLTAYDGEAAVSVAATHRPDVILLDIGLPKLNGYEVCRRIRAQEWGRDIFILAQSGWSQDEHRERTREAGFDHHLVKPVDPDVLVRLLRNLPDVRSEPDPG